MAGKFWVKGWRNRRFCIFPPLWIRIRILNEDVYRLTILGMITCERRFLEEVAEIRRSVEEKVDAEMGIQGAKALHHSTGERLRMSFYQ
jgi:hypothetical protein